jgi:hypothetical protein
MPRKSTLVSTSFYPPLKFVVKRRAAPAAAAATDNVELKKLRRQVEAFFVYHVQELCAGDLAAFEDAVKPLLEASDDYYEAFFTEEHMKSIIVFN